MPELELTSESFEHGDPIPERHTCSGKGTSPPLAWSSVPDGTRTLALIVHDADAPSGDFVHWLAWNIDPADGGIAEDKPDPAPPAPVRRRGTGRTATTSVFTRSTQSSTSRRAPPASSSRMRSRGTSSRRPS